MDNSMVYKYVSYDNFQKMIENKTILLTDITKSNDSTELELLSNMFEVCMSDVYDNERAAYFKNKYSKENFMALLKDNEEIINWEIGRHVYYVCCFSNLKDSLSQWRAYAETKKESEEIGGFSVGFKKDELTKICDELGMSYNNVIYKKESQMKILKDCIKKLIKKLKNGINNDLELYTSQSPEISVWLSDTLQEAVFFKHHFFSEEDEWRMCYWNVKDKPVPCNITLNNGIIFTNHKQAFEYKDDEIKTKEQIIKKMCEEIDISLLDEKEIRKSIIEKSISNNNSVTNHYWMICDESFSNLIGEIVIGPKCKSKKEEIQEYISRNNINCTISESIGLDIYVESNNQKKFSKK